MEILVALLLGFVLGYFFSVWVLCAVTVIAVVVCTYLWITCKEMATLIAMICTGFSGFALVAMWTTYFFTTNHTFVGDFVKEYIVR